MTRLLDIRNSMHKVEKDKFLLDAATYTITILL